jgi:cell fate regulator YaaT (PSP1 superfamily)
MDTPVTDSSYVVRYGVSRVVGEFSARGLGPISRGASVIIRSDRGHEWGTVLCPATEQSRTYLGTAEEHGRVMRLATPEDEAERDRLIASEKEAFAGGQEMVRERSLQMQLIDIERVFGGERLIFYYLAEDRVDFRELVKALAKRFQTRIEMRQIGIRDEAKLLADRLLQYVLARDAAGLDEDGQAAKGNARSIEDLRSLWPLEMLPAL